MGSGRGILAFAARRNPVRGDDGGPSDVRISEDVEIVTALRGKLRDDGAVWPRLEPVQRVGRDEVLLTRSKDDLVPDRVRAPVCLCRPAAGLLRRRAFEIEIHQAPATAERLLLTGGTGERRVALG